MHDQDENGARPPHENSEPELDDARACYQTLSSSAAQFLDYVLESDDRGRQLQHLADDLPPWSRTYSTTQLTWPTFVGPTKLREIKGAVENVCTLVKSLPERIFNNKPDRISDFYQYGDPTLMELLLEQPNGIKGAVARCDFVDGPAGFQCCEINMAPNVGGFESRFWEQKYFTNPVVSAFINSHGIVAAHHDPLRTFCLHIVDEVLSEHLSSDEVLNVAVMCPPHALPGPEGMKVANDTYSGFLRVANTDLKGKLSFFTKAAELSVKSGYMYCEDQRVHALVNYAGTVLPQQVYWCHKAGTICLYNGPLTKMMSDKRNLALLSQHEESDVFTDDERKIIRDHVPWSRMVVEGETTYQGQTVSFPDFLIEARDRLVLKLGIGLGGKEVFVGSFTPADEWNQRVQDALTAGGWMVQEYVDCHPFLYADHEGVVKAQNVVWGMFCCGSRYGGGYLRMLPRGVRKGVVNSGGGAVEGPILEVSND
jgi:hypothetical protein